MKKIVVGILAHVDAGKTTLSEAMLFTSGNIRKQGRVDHGDAFLDTYALERERGITIFSKQAIIQTENTRMTLLDTPGHVDFSAEMERTLQVLDYAILVISGADGVQGHTHTLWQLLQRYEIPTFLFINKMDQEGTDKEKLLAEIKKELDENCIDFCESDILHESIATCSEDTLESYLETGELSDDEIRELIVGRKLFPCFFGSALQMTGVEEFLEGFSRYTMEREYPTEFGARVYKIARDEQGNRLTYLKVTGGSLAVRSVWNGEKITQIRCYSGAKYEAVNEVEAGTICAVTGFTQTKAGDGIGYEQGSILPVLEPVLFYRIQLPEECDAGVMLPKLRQLEEEIPELHIVWEDVRGEIQVQIMGDVQIEILKRLIAERFGVTVEFGVGRILYKETIADTVEGVGHFEPLKHYAEVHLLMEPGEPGSGMQFATNCSEDVLDRNWQRLILTHLEERVHKGVLTGFPITDMKITVAAGRAHTKHTEGGDFRQATYRAVRQGLRQAESVLLEPYYKFRLEIPDQMIGRAMSDIEQMQGKSELPIIENGMAVLTGEVPVSTMRDYAKSVIAYSKGHGKLFCEVSGYGPCHNPDEVIAQIGYEPDSDLQNPSSSVFCAHGAGYLVEWDQVKDYMHVESILSTRHQQQAEEKIHQYREQEEERRRAKGQGFSPEAIGTDEIDRILSRAVGANKREGSETMHRMPARKTTYVQPTGPSKNIHERKKAGEEYLLVDGYNVIYAWEDLNALAAHNLDSARDSLMDTLCNYQAIRKCNLILVFDAYRVKGHTTEVLDYHNIHVVYTAEAETADRYIEKFAHDNSSKYRVNVATSDGVEQVIIRGQGCGLISARELKEEIERANKETLDAYQNTSSEPTRVTIGDHAKLPEMKEQ